MDAIRASLRIFHAVTPPPVRSDAAALAVAATDQARAGPRPIEAGSSGQSSRGSPDPRARDGPTDRRTTDLVAEAMQATAEARELWQRDMKLSAEHARNAKEGEFEQPPTFEYSRGPDGRLYASAVLERITKPPERDSKPRDQESEPTHGPAPPAEASAEDDAPRAPEVPSKVEIAYARAAADDGPRSIDEAA